MKSQGNQNYYRMRTLFLGILFGLPMCLASQYWPTDWNKEPWPASWIAHPTAPATTFGVYHFRRSFELTELPDSLPVMVSADNRYQLSVNGQWVGAGPSRGDLLHWRYATYDLRPYLQKGHNVIAAVVWNYGNEKAWFQQSLRTAFLLQPQVASFKALGTDHRWLVTTNPAYQAITSARERLGTYIVTGPQLQIDGRQYPFGWLQTSYDDTAWTKAKAIVKANPAGVGTEFYWCLVPQAIPDLAVVPIPAPTLIINDQISRKPLEQLQIPAQSERRILLTTGALTNAYFYLETIGGKDAKVQIHYAESLIDHRGLKGNRAAVAGKKMLGFYDEFILDGSKRTYSTLWFRTARYLELVVKTADEPLILAGLSASEVGYPFEALGYFRSKDNTAINEIWEIGWRTARLCAQETYVDCPYYEQLQYVGDTRIQALISLYVSGDDRLMRKAIEAYDQSRISTGLTMSRYPTQNGQIIPPYSLAWVEMVGDYWWHRPDEAFVKKQLAGVSAVLDWFEPYLLDNKLLGPMPYWNFVDWAPEWPWNNDLRIGGVPNMNGGSSIISLQYVGALRVAAQLYAHFDERDKAKHYAALADQVAQAVVDHCWFPAKQLFSDTPAGVSFSEQANIMGLLYAELPKKELKKLTARGGHYTIAAQRSLDEEATEFSFPSASLYFRFFNIQILQKHGWQEDYLTELEVWRKMLDQGFTTWPERPAASTRSDCHAWSASPNYGLPSTLAGIQPAAPGFAVLRIRPAEGVDFAYETAVPHHLGLIKLSYEPGHEIALEIPVGLPATLEWRGKKYRLQAGKQRIPI